MPFASSSSTTPSGTRQASSPVLTLIATISPHGPTWHGQYFSPHQNRAKLPHGLLRVYFSGEFGGAGITRPTSARLSTLTNSRPSDGLYDMPCQLLAPSVPGNWIDSVVLYRVNGPSLRRPPSVAIMSAQAFSCSGV